MVTLWFVIQNRPILSRHLTRMSRPSGQPRAPLISLEARHKEPTTRHLTTDDYMIDWSPLKDLIETHDRFLVTTHVRPDGDALGSEVGMAGLLHRRGRTCIVNASPTPPRYSFLDPDQTLFEWFGTGVKPAASPIAKWRSSWTSLPGTSLATWPS